MLQVLGAIILPAFTIIASVDSQCTFPKALRGTWYQNALGDIHIHSTHIERKGICMDSDNNEKYMVRRDDTCNLCLLILLRHHNVIQYKEGFCVEKDTLADVCRELKVEAILFTMVRVPSIPERCPFQDGYTFSYNNNSHGWCQKPESYVRPCAGVGKAKLSFKQCHGMPDSYQQEMHLDCLGHWKDGSNMYMYGALHKSVVISRTDTYRCFLYQSYGSQTRRMTMSADASCLGLNSPTDGPLSMDLDRDTEGWPDPGCRFPDWLGGDPWRDLTHKHEYNLDDGVFTVKYLAAGSSIARVKHEYRCLSEMSMSDRESSFVFLSLTSHEAECESRYQCMKIVKRGDNAAEIIEGVRLGNSRDKCYREQHFGQTYIKTHLIYRTQTTPVQCPIQGRYQVAMPGVGCNQATMDAGCNASNILSLHSCNAKYDWSATCLATWTKDGKRFFVARKMRSPYDNTADGGTKIANCISIEKDDETTAMNFDELCNKGMTVIGDKNKYVLANNPTSCGRKRVLSSGPGGHVGLYENEYGYETGGGGNAPGNTSVSAIFCQPSLLYSALKTLFLLFLSWICIHKTCVSSS